MSIEPSNLNCADCCYANCCSQPQCDPCCIPQQNLCCPSQLDLRCYEGNCIRQSDPCCIPPSCYGPCDPFYPSTTQFNSCNPCAPTCDPCLPAIRYPKRDFHIKFPRNCSELVKKNGLQADCLIDIRRPCAIIVPEAKLKR